MGLTMKQFEELGLHLDTLQHVLEGAATQIRVARMRLEAIAEESGLLAQRTLPLAPRERPAAGSGEGA